MELQPEIILIKDTREPIYGWDSYFTAPCVTRCLRTGDYSLEGYERRISIERKSLDDLVSCLGKNRDRFEAELQRGNCMEYFAVIVEGTYSQLASGDYVSRLHPNSGVESISAFEVRYGIPFLFCGSQRLAARKCESLLRKFYREKLKIVALEDDEIPF